MVKSAARYGCLPNSLKRGTVLQAGMFKQIEMPVPSYETRFVGDERDMLNMELQRDLPPNTPLRQQDLKSTTMVKRGQQVLVGCGRRQRIFDHCAG
jgi:flagella basal body P-ring formation protein FlgA